MSKRVLAISLVMVLSVTLVLTSGCEFLSRVMPGKDEFQLSIDKMENYRSEIENECNGLPEGDVKRTECSNFLEKSETFMQDIQSLRQAVKYEDLEEINSMLEKSKTSYQEVSDSQNKIGSEKGRLFMTEADKSFRVVISEIKTLTEGITESKQNLQNERDEKKGEQKSLADTNVELQQSCSEMERQLGPLESDKRDKVKDAVGHLALWIVPAFVVGFGILIPWYRKFANEEEYWGFYTKKTSRTSPVFIMMCVCIAALLLLIAYLVVEGYLGAIL